MSENNKTLDRMSFDAYSSLDARRHNRLLQAIKYGLLKTDEGRPLFFQHDVAAIAFTQNFFYPAARENHHNANVARKWLLRQKRPDCLRTVRIRGRPVFN